MSPQKAEQLVASLARQLKGLRNPLLSAFYYRPKFLLPIRAPAHAISEQ